MLKAHINGADKLEEEMGHNKFYAPHLFKKLGENVLLKSISNCTILRNSFNHFSKEFCKAEKRLRPDREIR